MKLVCILSLLVAAVSASAEGQTPAPSAIDRTFDRLYNLDFAGAHAILDAEERDRPEDPLVYAVRAAACLFSEFARLKILESRFFADDKEVTDGKRKPDPAARERLFRMTTEARRRALANLEADPGDRNAMFALCTAAGVETDYVGLVDRKYFRTYSLSKESQKYARKLLSVTPPVYDGRKKKLRSPTTYSTVPRVR